LMPGDGLDITPRISGDMARRIVAGRDGGRLAPPRLAVRFVREGDRGARPRLVWMVPAVQAGEPVTAQVDAVGGAVLESAAMRYESAAALDEYEAEWFDANGNGYDEGEECQGDVDGVVDAGDDDGLFGPYTGSAQYSFAWFNARRGYVFYYDRFGRLSYDGSDGPVLGYNESSETTNAFWSSACEEISWASGYGSTDTPVHELTHGVTQFTSGLVYQDESGALNESFSDVMAAISDPDADPWLHGEDQLDGNGPKRNLMNPGRDHTSDMEFPDDDNGDVHSNSGVGNKAAFLLSEGGLHPQTLRQVTGIGRAKTGRILYAAGTSLNEYAEYLDLRNTAVATATVWATLGLHGFTASNACSVKNAYAAVGAGTGDADCDGNDDDQTSDNDGDGVPDQQDNCVNVSNASQTDTDHDDDEDGFFAVGDACDTDDDNDSVLDGSDNCPSVVNASQADLDGDGIGNACDDSDGDDVLDTNDNCPDDFNPGQEDSNGDGFFGDACDPDDDGDGVANSQGDNCPNVANPDQADSDGDFYGDACDACPTNADPTPAFGLNGQPFVEDSDDDGIPDECDNSFQIVGRPWPGGILPGRDATPAILEVSVGRRTPVPLVVCPPPCAERVRRPQLELELSALPVGVTALVTDDRGQAWARSTTLPDGSRRLRFRPRGDRGYFLTFLSGGLDAPDGTDVPVTIERFAAVPPPTPPADVAIALASPAEPIVPGRPATFRATISNGTFADAHGARVAISSPQLTFGEPARDAGTLAAGHARTIEFTAPIPAGAVGPFTVTATVMTATVDPEPSNDTATVTIAVPLALGGFRPPVDNPPTVNSGKPGRTYPLKFQVTDAGGAIVSNLDAIDSIRAKSVTCDSFAGDPADAIEVTATGGTSLRFEDAQFVYNWKTPERAGCYELFVTLADGDVRSARFKLK
jgi:hypothetical protein